MQIIAAILFLIIFTTPIYANDVNDLIESKSSSEKKQIFTDLLHKSGEGCGKATRTFLQGFDKDDAAYWNVSCRNGTSYSIQVPANPTAKTRITDCGIMKAMGVECFKKFSD